MKLTKPERIFLAVTVLALAVMAGFFLGRNSAAAPVRITAQQGTYHTQASAAPSPEQLPGRGTEGLLSPAPAPPGDEVSTQSAGPSFPININTATAEELQALPGIGETRAKAIVAFREENGSFTYVEDLRKVSGIGEGILTKIIDQITVGEQNNG